MRCSGITSKGLVCKKKCVNAFCNLHKSSVTFDCGICLEESNRFKRTLDCSHNFCNDCICEWICKSSDPTCPMCRSKITNEEILNYSTYWGIYKGYIYTGTLCKIDLKLSEHYDELINHFNFPINVGITEKMVNEYLHFVSNYGNDIFKTTMIAILSKATFETIYIKGVPGGERFTKIFVFV